MKRTLSAALVLSLCTVAGSGAQQPSSNTLPQWWLAHVDFITRDGGVWFAPNATATSDTTAPDAFGMEWTVSNERHVLTGRLYGMKGTQESREYWSFREFYHPGEQRVIIEQWGGPGVYGKGETTSPGTDRGHVEVTFWLPDGRSWREGHRNIESGDEYITDSFDIDSTDTWTPNGHYVWQRQRPSPRLTFAMTLDRCDETARAAIVRCAYDMTIGIDRSEYRGELQITDLANAPILAVTSTEPTLQPSMVLNDQVCEVLTIPNSDAVHEEMGHLGMNAATVLYGWFCRTRDPDANPPSNLRVTVDPQHPFTFRYTLDVDLSSIASRSFRNCAYIDWDASGLTAPQQSPQACIDFRHDAGISDAFVPASSEVASAG